MFIQETQKNSEMNSRRRAMEAQKKSILNIRAK